MFFLQMAKHSTGLILRYSFQKETLLVKLINKQQNSLLKCLTGNDKKTEEFKITFCFQ